MLPFIQFFGYCFVIVDLETIMADSEGPSEVKEDVADVSLFLFHLS